MAATGHRMRLSGYRHEALVLALVALAALSLVRPATQQDRSRLALSLALLEQRTTRIDPYAADVSDRARRGGHYYSDKAPGLAALATVPVAAVAVADRVLDRDDHHRLWTGRADRALWFVRLAVGGLFFLVGVLVIGRVAEGLAPRTGAAAAVAFGLGTLAHPLALSLFAAVPTGVAGLLALVLLRTGGGPRAAALAGGLAGLAVALDYKAALVALALALYALRLPLRGFAAFLAGAAPPLALLALYHAVSFGSPLRVPYAYLDNEFADEQRRGFFGIQLPRADATWDVLAGERGLVLTPVVAVAAAGLVLLWRRGLRAEAACAGAVGAGFLVLNVGYFLPYGGVSPGPRFVVPGLVFLALGLGPALARWPVAALATTVVSVATMTIVSLAWGAAPEEGVVAVGAETLAEPIFGGGHVVAAAVCGTAALAALTVAARPLLRRP